MPEPTKLLIVDDSRIYRSIIENCLAGYTDIEVIGSVFSGEKALEFIKTKRPDVITLDQEMLGLNGLDTLKKIQEINAEDANLNPMKVIMLSSHTKKGAQITIDALEAGAFDFITKPTENKENLLQSELIRKINSAVGKKNFSQRAPSPIVKQEIVVNTILTPTKKYSYDAIIIGVSTGGPKALLEMLPALCKVTAVPILIVQHMPPDFTESLAQNLDKKCEYHVMEGKDDDEVQSKKAYIAPGGRHMIVRKVGLKVMTYIVDGPPENGCRPSVDVLFRSASSVYQNKVVAIILTGMGNDGAKSLAGLKRAGAHIIAQDEASSVVWGMPGSAVATGFVDAVLPLNQVAQYVSKL